MGGGKKSKAPAAPNYEALQASDALANRQTAQELTRWNRPTQIDQFGNKLGWYEDENGNWTQYQQLNPAFSKGQEEALWAYRNAAGQAMNQGTFQAPSMQKVYDNYWNSTMHGDFWNNAGGIGDFANQAGAIGEFDRTQGDRVAADMYESAMSRLRPEQQRTQEALDVKLRQQGLQPGTEAYNRAMQNEMTAQGDVTAKLGLDSTAAGYNAARDIYNTNLAGQGQRFDQQMGGYYAGLAGQGQRFDQAAQEFQMNKDQDYKALQAAMQLYNMDYDQAFQQYTLPMERAQAAAQLYSMAPGAQWQGFGTATGYSPADMTGAANATYQAKMGNYNAGQNKKGGLLGAGTSLGSAFLGSK